MIDTKELRRLAQAATPGPWEFWHGMIATDIDNDGGVVIAKRPTPSGGKLQARVDTNFQYIVAAYPAASLELLDRLEAAESVLKDFGTTAQEVECWLERYRCIEREAEALRTRLEAAEADALEQARLNGMGGEREAALMAKLEAAEKERDALRARIEALERQEPVAFALYSGWARKAVYFSEIEACDQRDRRQLTADLGGSLEAYRVVPLIRAHGAKGEGK